MRTLVRRNVEPLILAAALIGTILVANAAVQRFGVVPVGFGLMAPAGVFFAGVAFILRDGLQERDPSKYGWVLASIAVGTVLAVASGQGRIALGSGAAFLCSELIDFGVYTLLRNRAGYLTAAVVSNLFGAVVDSLIFLSIAFGSLSFFTGQVVGKMWVTVLFALGYVLVRRAVLPRHS